MDEEARVVGALPSQEMVEAELAMDRRVYGSCYWRVVDGEKVRVHPRDVIVTRDGELLDAENGTEVQK